MADATVSLSIHFDAVSTWLWSYDSWDMPTRHSRGVYGADVGAPRLLDLLDRYDVPTTWCIPGHTIESFPEICEEVHARDHGVQHHDWTHNGPSTFESKRAEKRDIERGIESIRDLTGERPTGDASPAWDFSEHTLDILQELDFEWDSSVMAVDFRPHYLYGGWEAPEDGAYQRGEPTGSEIPTVIPRRTRMVRCGKAKKLVLLKPSKSYRSTEDNFVTNMMTKRYFSRCESKSQPRPDES